MLKAIYQNYPSLVIDMANHRTKNLNYSRNSQMAWWEKLTAAKAEYLNSNPEPSMVEGETNSHKISSDLYTWHTSVQVSR